MLNNLFFVPKIEFVINKFKRFNMQNLRLGEIQLFFELHGPQTPVGQEPCVFDKGQSLVMKCGKSGDSMYGEIRPKQLVFAINFKSK